MEKVSRLLKHSRPMIMEIRHNVAKIKDLEENFGRTRMQMARKSLKS